MDINEDPNEAVDVPISTVLTASEVGLGYALGGEGTRMPASIVQYYAGHRGQPLEYAQYNITPASTDGVWTSMYNVLMDLKKIELKGSESGDLIYVGMSQILQAYTFSVVTDLFGDIPYSEALQGAANITPAYDTQEDIYAGLIDKLDEGIANVSSGSGSLPSTADVIYGGDTDSWVRFANSLKLRLYNHLSKRDASAAADFLATNPSLIDSYSYNAEVSFLSTTSNANPIYQFDVLSGRKDQAVCSTIVNEMESLSDPRLELYFAGVANDGSGYQGQIKGNDPGGSIDDSGENLYSRVGSAYASIDSSVMLISAAEVNFIKAEVYQRAGNTTSAKSAFEAAILQDFNALGISNSYAGYIANSDVAYNSTLQRIMEQKWITMFQAPFESWVDWRRTGYPDLELPEDLFTNDFIPRNLPYPQIEINVNNASLSTGPGVPVMYSGMSEKMWWDQ